MLGQSLVRFGVDATNICDNNLCVGAVLTLNDLQEAGNMRPMGTEAEAASGGSVQPSAGRWSLKQSTVMLYYRKPGELSHR